VIPRREYRRRRGRRNGNKSDIGQIGPPLALHVLQTVHHTGDIVKYQRSDVHLNTHAHTHTQMLFLTITEVTLRRARLVLKVVTVHGYAVFLAQM